jgi:glucosamine-6-phosphate deaminase
MFTKPSILPDPVACGRAAAEAGAVLLRQAIAEKGRAVIIVATGASQFQMLEHLVSLPDIAWNRVTGFHLDEYAGLPMSHPASFRGYLWQRFLSKLPVPLADFHYVSGEGDLAAECQRLGRLIAEVSVDVAFIGIGENGHIAFNDPPADFVTEEPYLVVALDEACRRQQLGEGWFPNLEAVPTQAISMSPRQILRSHAIICTVPDSRKARAVQQAIQGEISPELPASILQKADS